MIKGFMEKGYFSTPVIIQERKVGRTEEAINRRLLADELFDSLEKKF